MQWWSEWNSQTMGSYNQYLTFFHSRVLKAIDAMDNEKCHEMVVMAEIKVFECLKPFQPMILWKLNR